MTLLGLILRPGQSIFDQLVSAAQKAILSGELTEGQAFPSVRTLAADLKIHPNTAHKAVQYLIHERWLEMRPGLGTVVASVPRSLPEMQRQLMEHEIAALIAEARRIGWSADELKRAIDSGWEKTAAAVEVGR
ncbi:MAG TPA: GntR family transcriptional regulator [Acidobacteriaceae bacterium]|nr:GntR family transcriptional regulator [Acidobacteriaceae bacterium]